MLVGHAQKRAEPVLEISLADTASLRLIECCLSDRIFAQHMVQQTWIEPFSLAESRQCCPKPGCQNTTEIDDQSAIVHQAALISTSFSPKRRVALLFPGLILR